MAELKAAGNNVADVEAFMSALDYPLKAEVKAIRACIRGVNPDISEEVKWNAPSFGYRGAYLVTLNLQDKKQVRLVFHNPLTPQVQSDLLEGDFPDGRRLAVIRDAADFARKRSELERVVRELIALIESSA